MNTWKIKPQQSTTFGHSKISYAFFIYLKRHFLQGASTKPSLYLHRAINSITKLKVKSDPLLIQ